MQKNSWAPVAPKPAATFVNPYLNNNRGNEVSGPSTGENEEYNSYSDEEDYQTRYCLKFFKNFIQFILLSAMTLVLAVMS